MAMPDHTAPDEPVTAPDPSDVEIRPPEPKKGWLSPLNRRRWANFKANRRAFWSLWIFAVLYGLSLMAEFIANDKPLLVHSQGAYYTPIFNFYPETEFGGDFRTEAVYRDIEVQCLIVSGGLEDCWDDPAGVIEEIEETGAFEGAEVDQGWILWPLIPYSYNTINDLGQPAPSPPDSDHWLGTDDTARDVLARVIYGFRLSVSFALIVTLLTSVIGDRGGRSARLLWRLARLDLPTDHRDLERDTKPVHHHHYLRDIRDEFLAIGLLAGALWLDRPRWGRPGRVSEGA
jgi:microcin C transport system permease protein